MRNHYRPWFALGPSVKKYIEPISTAPVLYVAGRGYLCNNEHCGCRTKPLEDRINGFIHGVIKSPLGR